ncbi:hypothetical protein VTO73DRAFT_4360 [Trametes versicolor]
MGAREWCNSLTKTGAFEEGEMSSRPGKYCDRGHRHAGPGARGAGDGYNKSFTAFDLSVFRTQHRYIPPYTRK